MKTRLTGTLKEVSRDFKTNKLNITFQIEEQPTNDINFWATCEKLSIIVDKFRKKRSLDANGYYWQLTTKLAEANHVSKSCQHNMNLRRYGQAVYMDGKLMCITIPDTDEAENESLEAETYHIKPTSKIYQGSDDVTYRIYILLKGSSDFDTREMSVLIDGVASECKEVGIDTLPPAEIERMLSLWKSGKT